MKTSMFKSSVYTKGIFKRSNNRYGDSLIFASRKQTLRLTR